MSQVLSHRASKTAALGWHLRYRPKGLPFWNILAVKCFSQFNHWPEKRLTGYNPA
ncbi:MAG: hypothetical protein JNJ77_21970 [Planctomycetia bacterium]|nr:hypothetical protein [Planctomycetia bacterium]